MITIKVCQITLFLLFALWCLTPTATVQADQDTEQVEAIAKSLGDELWDLAQRMTKSQEITKRYKKYHASVMTKSGEELIESIVENVGRMFFRKIEAVRCILLKAENVSENFELNETMIDDLTYYSSKYSKRNGRSPAFAVPESTNGSIYLPMKFNQDTHFYNISVNTTHSSVHVPTNIYDRDPEVTEALVWSEELDKVFVQNYNSDPALSWQYFGSETGILRHYPAMSWDDTEDVDTYDCRRRSWYIETATCSKDVVILLDNSGSMNGFRNFVAQNTVRSILETFSNNDFINIYNYSAGIDEVIPCFNGSLVQATPENIAVFNKAVQELSPEGYANVSNAFIRAFELLERYRNERKCNETGCNQAIMLITDGVPGNLTEVFDRYNRIEMEDGTFFAPVRIFTYLLGKEVTNVREIQWMACLNRGYYSHIQTLDEIQEEVLKYVSVIALPLVLQEDEHPPTWTHAFKDRDYTETGKKPPRLMISVGVPAFDKKANKLNETKTARLLGVAGTDVPVEDIDKLTLPYKLGVNGYSFIVSNNGYVLLHPDLRPVDQDQIKLNYNSIDMTEVEQFADGTTERHVGDDLLKLRTALVNSVTGKMENQSVRFHYDNFKRASIELQDYYYAPLKFTPFALALVLPSGYGNTWIKVNNEIYANGVFRLELSEYFLGDNWKLHPDWVYCKYHYLEGNEFNSSETEFAKFLTLFNDEFEWSEQYEADNESDINTEPNCGRKSLGSNSYYCNRELVQLLLFDAKVTNESYGRWRFESEFERQLINSYNATLRFVSTMSGLTRWQFIHGEKKKNPTDKEFGDFFKRAIDETWYKSAILQHKIDPQSFVYSVPHEMDTQVDTDQIQVTASYAIFPRDGGLEAPAAVVGFQFTHKLWHDRFLEIINTALVDGEAPLCASEDINCYVIDNNGYIVLSEELNHTGRFFGKVEGGVMESMVQNGTFERIVVYDWQALCSRVDEVSSDGHILLTPFRIILLATKYLLTRLFWTLARVNSYMGVLAMDYGESEYSDTQARFNLDEDKLGAAMAGTKKPKQLRKGQNQEEEDYFNRNQTPILEVTYFGCDKQYDLYDLNEANLVQNNALGRMETNCSSNSSYIFRKINNSNLMLVIVEGVDDCNKLSTDGKVIEYDAPFPCHKLKMNELHRRRLTECFTAHPNETEMHYCGGAGKLGSILGGLLLFYLIVVIL